jgi:hypothetical protein
VKRRPSFNLGRDEWVSGVASDNLEHVSKGLEN